MDQQEKNKNINVEMVDLTRIQIAGNEWAIYLKLREIRETIGTMFKEQTGADMLCARVGWGVYMADKTNYFAHGKETGRINFLENENDIRCSMPTISMRLTFELKDFLTSNQFLKNKIQQDGTI